MKPQPVDVIAHRGGEGQWPGETTFAFTRAIESHADVIEMDVGEIADDPPVLVLMHSSDISKMTEAQATCVRTISKMTLKI